MSMMKPPQLGRVESVAMFVVLSLLLLALSSSPAWALSTLPQPTQADEILHKWCEVMNIPINPAVQLLTTSASVAGRGVFAVKDIAKDTTIAAIPTYVMFHPQNAAKMFPEVAARIRERAQQHQQCPAPDIAEQDDADNQEQKQEKPNWLARILRRLFRRRSTQEEEEEIPWQAELTEYALAVLNQQGEEHPFAPWIRQWQRDDPVLKLFESGNASRDHPEALENTAEELNRMLPLMPLYKIMAALTLRMEQWESHQSYLTNPTSKETASMYTTLCSRSIGVSDDIVAVVPFHDMINHSFEPNLGLAISEDERFLEIYTLDSVPAGKELFFCYSAIGKEYDENAALWMLVQWGIPVTESEWKVTTVG